MIRKAKPSEIHRLMEIAGACAEKMIREGIYQWNEAYPQTETFVRDIQRGELYVILSGKEIAGCVVISTFKDEVYDPVAWLSADSNNFYIHRLAVHPKYQHRGMAKDLMDFAESYARKQKGDSIRLDTFSKNKRNQRFYEARGYTRLEEIYFPRQSKFPFYCYELLLK